jgi:hypothetical protein
MDLMKDGADLPPDIYPFLQLDQNWILLFVNI